VVSPLYFTPIFSPPHAGHNTPKKIPGKISDKLKSSDFENKNFSKKSENEVK